MGWVMGAYNQNHHVQQYLRTELKKDGETGSVSDHSAFQVGSATDNMTST